MPEHGFDDLDPGFERQFGRRLTDYAEGGVRPFDALEIARLARASGGGRRTGRQRRNPFATIGRWVLVAALLVVGLVAFGVAGGLLPPDPVVVPTPTAAAGSPVPSPAQTTPPANTPMPTPSLSPTSAPTERPTPAPTAQPTPSPSASTPPAASPTPGAPTPTPIVGAWREITDFPFGDATHLTAITAGGPGYVAVGWASDGAGGTIGARAWTSVDGQSWTRVTSPTFEGARLLRVVRSCDGDLFALGPIPNDDPDFPDVGQYRVWRSADGSAWELLPQPPQFAGAVIQDVVASGCIMFAGGYRNQDGTSHAVIWSSLDGVEWRESTQPPDLTSISRLAPIDPNGGTVVALGNPAAGRPAWQFLWHSIELEESWQPATMPVLEDVHLADVAGQLDGFMAAGWQGDLGDTRAFSLGSGDGTVWPDIAATDIVMAVMNRVFPVERGFVALGAAVEIQTSPCAPVNCVEVVPVEPRAWRHTFGVGWQPVGDPPFYVDEYSAIAVGPNGVIVTNYTFDGGVWFAPLGQE